MTKDVVVMLRKKMGRRPKTPPRDAADKIAMLAAQGANMRGIAMQLGVCFGTLRKWLDTYPELEEAFANGREIERQQLHNFVFRAAENGNVIANIFLLKARHGYIEADKVPAKDEMTKKDREEYLAKLAKLLPN
jgi:lambda repressor-like predicted transcriptional regulator